MKLTHCLIVEDHEPLRLLLSNWLEAIFPAVQFLNASSGEAALEIVKRYQPQVIVMDVGLSGMNGIETTRKIKQDFPNTFVIIHTIHDEQPFHMDALHAGADAFVIKNRTTTDLVPILMQAITTPHQ
ncbi:MAG: response regulator transcription factor [Anaerolineales bacterium]|nr:response regulator transcription factor [Anaerolineales bacterium]